ncbi:hypothetical protein C0995_013774 [Termitomyces sp. Mi166|nr:hypothetical protein C0995_013774 [Termitomyces sp. Mi166\
MSNLLMKETMSGPNELSVIDVDAALGILGAGGLPKGRSYEARKDPNAPGNLLALAGRTHTDRRRLWTRAFTKESLAEYEDALVERVNSLLNGLASSSKQYTSTDLSLWLNFFAVDFMGDMAATSVLSQVPWATSYVQRLPFLAKNMIKLRKFAVEHGMARTKKEAKRKDLWYHLSDEAGLEKVRPPVGDVIADSALTMIAGSDTTATGISNLFYLLLSHPKSLKRLRDEVDSVYQDEGILSSAMHSQLPYLTACINEALRLLPPVLTSGARQVPFGGGGRVFGGRYIPEGTQVYIPPYSIHRNPEYFSPGTEEFMPERWLSERAEDTIRNLDAFIPFSYGAANCVGRNLARQEMMMVTAGILQRFDIHFADGFDPSSYLEELHDHFVTKRGALLVALSRRF